MDCRFELGDALAARKAFDGVAYEANIGQGFNQKVDQCADRTEKQDDVDPIGIWPPSNEVDDCQSLQYQTPRVEKVTQNSHGYSSLSLVKIETYHRDTFRIGIKTLSCRTGPLRVGRAFARLFYL